MALRDTLADPDYVAALLLLQLEEGVEDPKVELLHEGILVQPHLKYNVGLEEGVKAKANNMYLLLKEFVLQGFLSRVGTGPLKALLVLTVVLRHLPNLQKQISFMRQISPFGHLIIIVSPGESLESFWGEPARDWIKLCCLVCLIDFVWLVGFVSIVGFGWIFSSFDPLLNTCRRSGTASPCRPLSAQCRRS